MAKVREKQDIDIPSRLDGEQNPAYFAAYYARHRDRIRAQQKEWRRRNPAKAHGPGPMTYKRMLINVLLQRDGDSCGICGLAMLPESISVDHVTLRSHGGSDVAENLRLAHLTCNLTRGRRRG